MFNKRCQDRQVDRLDEFLRLAAALYDPTRVDAPIDSLPSMSDVEDSDFTDDEI